jgi:hypothetical protein
MSRSSISSSYPVVRATPTFRNGPLAPGRAIGPTTSSGLALTGWVLSEPSGVPGEGSGVVPRSLGAVRRSIVRSSNSSSSPVVRSAPGFGGGGGAIVARQDRAGIGRPCHRTDTTNGRSYHRR